VPDEAGRIKPLAFVVCDDIRREITGKDIYIGVYTADVVVPQLPFDLPMAIALLCEPIQIGKASLYMEIIPPGSPGHFAVTLDVDATLTNPSEDTASQNLSIVLGGIPMKIAQEGDIVLKVRHVGLEKWELVRRISVKRGIPPGPQVPTVAPIASSLA